MTLHIIIYRPHNRLNMETQHIGPFASWGDAYDHLCTMPALGIYREDGCLDSPGVKFIQYLVPSFEPEAFEMPDVDAMGHTPGQLIE